MEYRFAGSQFFRDNYAVEANGVDTIQAYFANVANGVFVFIGEDQKSVDEMTKSMETFDRNACPATSAADRCTTVYHSINRRRFGNKFKAL